MYFTCICHLIYLVHTLIRPLVVFRKIMKLRKCNMVKRNEDNWSNCFLMDVMQFVTFQIVAGVDCTWYKGIPFAFK